MSRPSAPDDTHAQPGLAPLVAELLGDFDALELLDRLMRVAADSVGATSAALLVPDGSGGLQVMASTSETATELELFQVMSGEGPAFDCLGSGASVLATDLSSESERWPTFVRAARALGTRSVGSVHMGVRGQSVGALNLFDPTVKDLEGLQAAQGPADVAVLAVLHAGVERDGSQVLQQVRRVLDRRVLVEQAKGVLAEWTGRPPGECGPLLLQHARRRGLPLEVLAHQLVHLQVDRAELLGPEQA